MGVHPPDPRDCWWLSYGNYGADGKWRGRLIQTGEYAAVIDVLHEDYTTSEGWDVVTGYSSYDELREAAIRQWKNIGYLAWGPGAVLFIDGEEAAEVKPGKDN